jgi:serine/threonine-protein kinase
VIGGKYRPLRLIARGGMGAVYEVVHANTGERLALKLMSARSLLSPGLVERFRREARIQSAVKSEHVVRVIDADVAPEIDGAPFLVMELLEGRDFERLCAERRPTPAEVVDWLHQVAQALDKAHQARIVHRDLKPENIFLAEREGLPPIVKVLDFGVAKLMTEGEAGATQTGQILGTPRYMAPEQAAGSKGITPAADRFALGLIAFRLLAGRHYFDGDNWVTLLRAVTRGPTDAPSALGCQRGPAFDAWFARACAMDPGARFDTCAEAIDALSEALAGTVTATKRGPWTARRALGLGLTAGAFGVAALVWGVGRERTTTRAVKPAPLASTPLVAAPPAVARPAAVAFVPPAPHEPHPRRRHTARAEAHSSVQPTKEPEKSPEKKSSKDSIWEEP